MSETGKVIKIKRNSPLWSEWHFDSAIASEVVLGSVQHFSEAQNQIRVNFLDDAAGTSVIPQIATGQSLFVPLQSFQIRLSKRPDGRPFGLYIELCAAVLDDSVDLWVSVQEGWGSPLEPYGGIAGVANFNELSPKWKALSTSSSLLYFPRSILDQEISPVRRGRAEFQTSTSEVCAATISIFARRGASENYVKLHGMIAREYFEIGE